jgi:hypothetical protein
MVYPGYPRRSVFSTGLNYETRNREWREVSRVAEGVLSANPEVYAEALTRKGRFDALEFVGAGTDFRFVPDDPHVALVDVGIWRISMLPGHRPVASQQGYLSLVASTHNYVNDLYWRYVCSCAIRAAREVFAVLPPLETVLVNAAPTRLGTSSPGRQQHVLLSVVIPREGLDARQLEKLDAPTAVESFVRREAHRSSAGFTAVMPLSPQMLPGSPERAPIGDHDPMPASGRDTIAPDL